MDKSVLRKNFREIRQQISEQDAKNWSEQMAQDLKFRLRQSGFDGVIFLFAAIKGEPDILSFFLQERFQLALPKIFGDGRMNFYLWSPGDRLSVGSFGIREPSEDAILVTPRSGDVAVIPALSIDLKGQRLGAGGGYYDRWLAINRPMLLFTAGAVFPPCISRDPIPTDPYDQGVDFCLASY